MNVHILAVGTTAAESSLCTSKSQVNCVRFDPSDGSPEELPPWLLELGISREMLHLLWHTLSVVARRPIGLYVVRGAPLLNPRVARSVVYRSPDLSSGVRSVYGRDALFPARPTPENGPVRLRVSRVFRGG